MKLLICEDDISTITTLKKKINFAKFGIDEVLEAYNGEMSIEVIKKENPELILCDIGMPKTNGTEVLKFARENNKKMEFSFLTCYEDFKYAQMAVEYRATGYVTKPFKLKQIEEILSKMVANYKASCEHQEDDDQIKKDLLYSSVFKQVSDGYFGTNKELVQEYLEKYNMEFSADSKWKIVFTCLNIFDTMNSNWSRELLLYIAARAHDESLNNYVGSAHTIVNNDDRFLWCITFVDGSIEHSELEERCYVLNSFCKEHFSIEPVMLISNQFEFYNASSVLNELFNIIPKIRYYGGKIFYQDSDIDNIENETFINANQLLWYLKNRDSSGYEECISNILRNITKIYNFEQFKKELTEFFLTILKDNNVSSSVVYNNETIKKYSKEETDRKKLLEYSKELLVIYNEQINNASDSENIINRAKKFLDDNYRENIGRDDVAEIAFVTPNYLSKLFRNNMGMNLREYINQLRIEESKRLLLSTNMSVSEIASYVGYYNISYFSTIFHKLVGVSPAEWRTDGKEK